MDNKNNIPTEEKQDPRLIQPQIIGELRKDKIGKPITVIELALLLAIIMLALPHINRMLYDEDSDIYKKFHGVVEPTTTLPVVLEEDEEFYDGSKPTLLQEGVVMRYDDIIIKDIALKSGRIDCTIYAYTGIVNLDEKNYFLEISSSSGGVLGSIKLSGVYDNVETKVSLETAQVSFNANVSYTGRVIEMNDDDFPAVELEEDASGYSLLTCSKDDKTYTYSFQRGFLIGFTDEEYVTTKGLNQDEYINKLDEANKKAKSLGPTVAGVEEVDDGFIFTAKFDLDSDYVIPDDVVDYNYYPKNALAKRIKYTQESKGYDCE